MYLLDTNAFIILAYGNVTDAKLSQDTQDKVLNAERLCLSVVSLWEMTIKMKIGKLNIKGTVEQMVDRCAENGIDILPIKTEYLDKTLELPLLADHKDPFDRLIMAVSLIEGLPLVSTDERVRRAEYGTTVIY